MSIFASFEIGRKALRVQHKGMEVSGQNIANANTPGYTRQRAQMEAVPPPVAPGHSMAPGRGVVVSDIIRVRSEFYYAQMVNTSSHRSYWETRQDTYLGAEAVLMEPGDYSINRYLGDFFDTWQELSSSPEDAAVRAGLREKAISLTRSMEDVYRRLDDMHRDLSGELQVQADEVNRLLDVISEYNDQLRFIDALQDKSNELLDQLDLAVEDLARLLDVNVYRRGNGTVEIFSGGRLLVQEERAFHVELRAAEGSSNSLELVGHRGQALHVARGKIPALLEAVNEDIPNLQEELNRITFTLVEDINAAHSAGYGLEGQTGNLFFAEIAPNGVPAALQFRVADVVIADSTAIAASSRPGEPGNGEQALSIARLRDIRGEGDRLEGYSIIEYYRGMVTSLGAEAQDSERMKEAFGRTESELTALHRSVAGVNMDEEMLNMSQFQHAWHAAARYLSYVDQMLTVLFTELGR